MLSTPRKNGTFTLQALPETRTDEWWSKVVNAPREHVGNNRGEGIRVAVIDTGAGPHRDLAVVGGQNFTDTGSPAEYADVDQHGTHVSGIIRANGSLVGIAPACELYAGRVFPSSEEGAANDDIAEAIVTAVDTWKCDILNMSLGGEYDELLEDRIDYATQKGSLCVVAAGNSSGAVEYPGALKNSFCVAAVGQRGHYPGDSIHVDAEPLTPGLFGADGLYAAEFTCRGAEVDACAPGVAVISTVPGNVYAAFDGTSMATPIVSGVAALVLSKSRDIMKQPRDQVRTTALRSKIESVLDDIKLPVDFQGKGFSRI
jgi:subtilisin family serine protease